MYWSAVETALVPPALVTVTSTVPASWAGDVAMTEVSETMEKVAVAAPNLTAVAPVKPVPVMATVAPPAGRPAAGLTALTVGAAT